MITLYVALVRARPGYHIRVNLRLDVEDGDDPHWEDRVASVEHLSIYRRGKHRYRVLHVDQDPEAIEWIESHIDRHYHRLRPAIQSLIISGMESGARHLGSLPL